MNWEVGQKVWVTGHRLEPRFETITKVGRKWVWIRNERFEKDSTADMPRLQSADSSYTEGVVWRSDAEWREHTERSKAWDVLWLHVREQHTAPKHLTPDAIRAIERQIFGETE